MLKQAILLVACVALGQCEDLLKFVPANVMAKAATLEKDVETIVKDVKGAAASVYEKPDFCGSLDCPLFKVLEKTNDYELREYKETQWVGTALTDISYRMSQYQMFMKLFRYISGDNVSKNKIAMTVPVIVRIIPGQGPACEDNFTMSFYVSENEAPAPNNKDVYLTKLPALRAYATSFGGFANQDKYIAAALSMSEALEKAGKTFEKSYFYTAGYDAPFKLFNRHNEVWFLAK